MQSGGPAATSIWHLIRLPWGFNLVITLFAIIFLGANGPRESQFVWFVVGDRVSV